MDSKEKPIRQPGPVDIRQILVPTSGNWAGTLIALDRNGQLWFHDGPDRATDAYWWRPIKSEQPLVEEPSK